MVTTSARNLRGWSRLSGSSNAATVRLSEAIGRTNVIRTARDLGISTPLPDKPSLALGSAQVSLLELTSAYAALGLSVLQQKGAKLPQGHARLLDYLSGEVRGIAPAEPLV